MCELYVIPPLFNEFGDSVPRKASSWFPKKQTILISRFRTSLFLLTLSLCCWMLWCLCSSSCNSMRVLQNVFRLRQHPICFFERSCLKLSILWIPWPRSVNSETHRSLSCQMHLQNTSFQSPLLNFGVCSYFQMHLNEWENTLISSQTWFTPAKKGNISEICYFWQGNRRSEGTG